MIVHLDLGYAEQVACGQLIDDVGPSISSSPEQVTCEECLAQDVIERVKEQGRERTLNNLAGLLNLRGDQVLVTNAKDPRDNGMWKRTSRGTFTRA